MAQDYVTVTTHRHKNGKRLRSSTDMDYWCLPDLQNLLGLGRVNVQNKRHAKGRCTNKINRVREMTFIHKEYVEGFCKRSKRNEKAQWVHLTVFRKPMEGAPVPVSQPTLPSQQPSCHAYEAKSLVLNFWMTTPGEVLAFLERVGNCDGLSRRLEDEAQRLYATELAKVKARATQ